MYGKHGGLFPTNYLVLMLGRCKLSQVLPDGVDLIKRTRIDGKDLGWLCGI